MMFDMGKNELQTLIGQMGADTWQLYCMLRLEANGNLLTLRQDEIAELIGVTSTRTVYTRIKKLEAVKVNGVPLIELKDKTSEYNIYRIANINVRKIFMETNYSEPVTEVTVKQTKSPQKKIVAKDVVSLWCERYKERYGVPYNVIWAKDTKLSKKLLDTYGYERLERIFEVIFRLYETKWQSKQFPRPTLGSTCSWLAAQAEALASANMERETEKVEITSDNGVDVLEEWTAKGWL